MLTGLKAQQSVRRAQIHKELDKNNRACALLLEASWRLEISDTHEAQRLMAIAEQLT